VPGANKGKSELLIEYCPFHCDMVEDTEPKAALETDRKQPASQDALNDTGCMIVSRGSKP
jgi:hypothetical protein